MERITTFSSGFSFINSYHDIPTVPPGHHLHSGSDQQEVTAYSDQPSLPCSPTNIHLLLILQTQDMWRQKSRPLSQAEYCQHPTQCQSSWNHHWLIDSSWL